MYELRYYVTPDGKQPLPRWIDGLRDRQAKARIKTRLDRLVDGNFGDRHDVGDGVYELRIDWGPGYRVYYARIGELILLLLCGGDKRSQTKDIERAQDYFKDYKVRSATRPR
jgi:putative addiction module killer protein